MAGLRIGWIACADKHALHEIAEIKHYLSICNSAPSEILTLMARRAKSVLVQRNLDIIAHNLGVLDAFMVRRGKVFSWSRSLGGCTGFVQVSIRNLKLCRELIVNE